MLVTWLCVIHFMLGYVSNMAMCNTFHVSNMAMCDTFRVSNISC